MNIQDVEIEEINAIHGASYKPMLSIYCIVYNMAEYLEECFEHILTQNTTYSYEAVIFDDASTDGSSEIVREYCMRYPGVFRAYIAKRNIYGLPNKTDIYSFLYRECLHGKYIAMCEGDDYWCDDNKIQSQIDFLEENPDFSLVMHNAEIIDYVKNERRPMRAEPSHEILGEELIEQKAGIWPTASMLGRREAFLCENFFFDTGIGDWTIQLKALSIGRIYYMERIMSAYRFMRPGSWSRDTLLQTEKRTLHSIVMIDFLDRYNGFTGKKFDCAIQERKVRYYEGVIRNSDMSGKEFALLCHRINEESDGRYERIINKMLDAYRQRKDVEYLSENLLAFIGQHKEIYILGAGRFGESMGECLQFNHIPFRGFLVSNDNQIKNHTLLGRKVKHVCEEIHDGDDVGVIVAIDCPTLKEWDILKDSVCKQGIVHYYNPNIINPV